jgi:hypothetical protein
MFFIFVDFFDEGSRSISEVVGHEAAEQGAGDSEAEVVPSPAVAVDVSHPKSSTEVSSARQTARSVSRRAAAAS